MILFIDTISPDSKLILTKDSEIISSKDINIHGKEYNDLLDIILAFLKDNDYKPDMLS
jgi:tRNA A37 threonylcarbamoyladenosine modification protein TsaB